MSCRIKTATKVYHYLIMAFLRQYIAPLLVVLVFLVALVAVSARIFLPADMAAPAPTAAIAPDQARAEISTRSGAIARLSPGLSALVNGLPEDL